MKIVYFTHSLRSCWNHGNAHFLRGVLRELSAMGCDVLSIERPDAWSYENLRAEARASAESDFLEAYPDLQRHVVVDDTDPEVHVSDADLVLVHEWNDPSLIERIGQLRRRNSFKLLFHDTHHRAISDPDAMNRFDLGNYDGVLAFGASLAEVYERRGWGQDVHVWHEAADARLFQPPDEAIPRSGLVWIGNWGDDERTDEIERFLLAPSRAARLPLDIHGVRYPPQALAMLTRYHARYLGWLANAKAPDVFARHLATVHVPRRFYTDLLPGIPTIRVFEALACGIPLVSAPWEDRESLFRPGDDFLVARSGAEMERHLRALAGDAQLRSSLAASGLARIRSRHTCRHRAQELLAIASQYGIAQRSEAST